MSANNDTATLGVVDYVVFGLLLVISAAVGVYFAYRDRKQNSKNYLLANRKISWWASGLSCTLSFFSGSTVIGYPAEIMYRGSAYVWVTLGLIMSNVVGNEVFLPIYYKNEMSSSKEYCGVRYGKYARYVATIIYILQTIAYTGVMIYAPALALSAVSDISIVTSVLSMGIVCTVYTTLGGLKAVIWTDVIQSIVLLTVMFVTLFVSADEVGGIRQAIDIARKGDRTDFNHFEFDPRYRLTFWSAVFGLGIMWISITSTNQAVVQRFLCCRSIREGKKAMYASIVITLFQFAFLLTLTGYVTYAYFSTCDPLETKAVSSEDQVLPLMVMKVFSHSPGVPGLFIAGVFAGALSTVSSAINGMTCVAVGDIIQPIVNWSDHTLLWISRGLTFIFGALCIAFAFLASGLGSIVEAALSLLGLCGGALLGPIAMGAFFPLANEKGAITGMVTALVFNIWLFVGAWIYPPPVRFVNLKSRSVAGCMLNTNDTISNISTIALTIATTETTMKPQVEARPVVADLYAVSFAFYAPIGLMVCMIVGLLVSISTGGLQSRHHVDPDLIYLPFEHPMLRWLPKNFRRLMIPKMGKKKQISVDINLEGDEDKKGVDGSSYAKDNVAYEIDVWSNSTYL